MSSGVSAPGITSSTAVLSAKDARRTLGALVACHTINDFYGLVMPPLLPALIQTFGLSYTQAGVIPFVTTALSAVLQPTLGYIADRRRLRLAFMAAGFLMFALSMLWLGNTGSYAMLIVAAGFLGLSASTYHPQSATLLAHYFRDRRGWSQGIHGIGNGLGFMLAPLSVGFLAQQFGWRTGVMMLAVPAVLAVVIIATMLREPDVRGGQGMLAGITGPLVLLTLINGCALGISSGFVTWLPSYYSSQGYNLLAAGALTASMAGAGLIAQPLGGTLSDRFGRRDLITVSLIGVGIFQLLFVGIGQLAVGLPLMIVATLLVGFWGSLMPPVTMVYASEIAAGERTGMAVGVVWGLGTLVSALFLPLSGSLIDALGFPMTYSLLAVFSLLVAVVARALPRVSAK